MTINKKALLLFWHGVGDAITLTPSIRFLFNQGYSCDIVCRQGLHDSKLFDYCDKITTIPVSAKFGGKGELGPETSPSTNGERGIKARAKFKEVFRKLSNSYDKCFDFSRSPQKVKGGKINRSLKIVGGDFRDSLLNLFIPPKAEDIALSYIETHYPDGYIFRHTKPGAHGSHDWREADNWILDNLPSIPQFNTGRKEKHAFMWDDINVSFVMAREAKYRVLSSSVFVHACDAMNVTMDAVYYGVPNPHGLPLDLRKIKSIFGEHAPEK